MEQSTIHRPLASRYRSHTCGELRPNHVGHSVRLSGWIDRIRDHGNLLFIDLRDHYGFVQCVLSADSVIFKQLEKLRLESVLFLEGEVLLRSSENINPQLATGKVEIRIEKFEMLSAADVLPFQINQPAHEIPEDQRLRYRFLDLRREKLHQNIVLRSKIIACLRQKMIERGFLEYTTPILTSSSPEGARDYLVPSRLHPGKFYALPQAPQQFKQLLMIAGFDRYFQIAPCFRDEDARADRSPGEFYQLDIEMAFVEQQDVFKTMEPVLYETYKTFSSFAMTPPPFPQITYDDSMLRYGCDKPDLRNPLVIQEVTSFFEKSAFTAFRQAIEKGAVVRAIVTPHTAKQPRSFFDKLIEYGQSLGLPGVAYLNILEAGAAKGPLVKFLSEEERQQLISQLGCQVGDSVFFVCEKPAQIFKPISQLRMHLGQSLQLLEKDVYRFVWIVDFPFYEWDEQLQCITFSHNPFSMPQGGMEALWHKPPLSIKSFQYDIVCNGVELSSGAIRNHRPDIMLKAFDIAGYSAQQVEERFSGMLNALRFGAPPHGGFAPGIDRMVMQIANEPNIREVIAFPMNQQAQDLMMKAPAAVDEKQLRELCLKLAMPAAKG